MSDFREERERDEVPSDWIDPVDEPPVRNVLEEAIAEPARATPPAEPTVAQDLLAEWTALRRAFQGRTGRSTAAYQVPKRFGMGPLLGMMLLYSVLFACLRWAGFDPWVYLFLGLLGVVIGFGQMQGQGSPRFSSILTGAVALPGFLMAYMVFVWLIGGASGHDLLGAFCLSFVLFFAGGFVGYVVGTVLAGVFLVGDQVEQAFYRWTGQQTAEFGDSDVSHQAPI